MEGIRWIIHYDEKDVQYERTIKRLEELGIPYRPEGGSKEGLVACTPFGRFFGNGLLDTLKGRDS